MSYALYGVGYGVLWALYGYSLEKEMDKGSGVLRVLDCDAVVGKRIMVVGVVKAVDGYGLAEGQNG